MKVIGFIIFALVLFTFTIILSSGCKYDVAEPQWDITEYNPPDTIPAINSISPSQAVPGTNLITILGENFNLVPDSNIRVEIPYVTNIMPEIVEKTSTSITIRRPDLVTDSCYAKVWAQGGEVVRFGPYKIDPVLEEWGSFLENQQLNALAADNAENLYVVQGAASPFTIVKISAAGERSVFVDSLPALPPTGNIPSDAVIGPDGNLYILRDNRHIQKVNTVSGQASVWHRLSANERLSFGDFDANGYFYTGGLRTTDLWIIAPDSSSSPSGMYSTASDGDTIWTVKVYGNQVYVVAGSTAGLAIWRHSIVSPGTVGPKELVLDFSARFGYHRIESIAVSADDKIFIGTDVPEDPMLIFDPARDNLDYFYKDILSPYCKGFSWGSGNYFYMMSGNLTPAQTWDCFRIDAGITSAQ